MLRHLFAYILILIFTGCASSLGNRNAVRINELDLPLAELRSLALSILPAGPRATSPNGRELLSRHFVLEGSSSYRPAGDATERFFAQILVLGDRRPYDVEILVTREKRVLRGNQFTYIVTGHDSRLAKELERKLRSELSKRREDRNVIDDFRVF